MKRGLKILIILFAVVAILFAAETGQSLFQKALTKERAEADPAGAIRLYERVMKEFGKDRRLAAEALFRIGECHQALGNAEARRPYERIVREFGDQAEVTAKARTKLAALSAAEKKPKFTKIRVPTKLPRLTERALSPDGQQLAYVSGGSVWLLPVHGASHPEIAGPPRRITEPIRTWGQNVDIVWSRDGRWIALYVWEHGQDGSELPMIYMLSSSGGEPWKVPLEPSNNPQDYWDYNLSLSPDGSWLAYTTCKDGEDASQRSIYLAPTKGGPSRRLTQPIMAQPAFSSDGKKIAYVGLLTDPDRDPARPLGRQIWIAPVNGGAPVLVYEVSRPERLRSPVWSPDGLTLAFLVNPRQPGKPDEQAVLVPLSRDGRPAGPPTKIDLPHATISKLAGWSSDNKIGLVFRSPELTALYTVPASGGHAIQVTPKGGSMPSWTPDGKRIYFDGAHGGPLSSIEYVPAQGGPVVRILVHGPHPLQPSYPSGGISVSPDGKRILFQGHFYRAPVKWLPHMFTIPIDGGEVTELATGVTLAYQPCWSPDGKSVAFIGLEEVNKNVSLSNIYAMPAEGGQAQKLTADADKVTNARIAWSPDGKHIAYYSEDDRLKLVPVEGGPSRVLVEGLRGYRLDSGLAWSPDGKQLAYITQDRIWKLNLETGKSDEVQTRLDAHHMQLAWSPDGSTIAFSALQGGEPELWLMSDFLPLLQPKR